MNGIRQRWGEEPAASVTTGKLTNISQTGATLSGSYELTAGTVTESGFEYGLSSDALTDKITISNPTATFSTTVPNP